MILRKMLRLSKLIRILRLGLSEQSIKNIGVYKLSCRRVMSRVVERYSRGPLQQFEPISHMSGNVVGILVRAAHEPYIIEHHRRNMHTVVDFDFHRVH